MQMVDLPLDQLQEAPWNPNQMDEAMLQKLRESLTRYGLVQNLVVRPLDKDCYEVLSGNQRLQVLRELKHSPVPCMVVNLDDAHARLLGRALNRIQGEDDLGLRAELLRVVLQALPQRDVLNLLPETTQSLQAMASLGQEDMAQYLQNWQWWKRLCPGCCPWPGRPHPTAPTPEAPPCTCCAWAIWNGRKEGYEHNNSISPLSDLRHCPDPAAGQGQEIRQALPDADLPSGRPPLPGFINDQSYVKGVLTKLEAQQ